MGKFIVLNNISRMSDAVSPDVDTSSFEILDKCGVILTNLLSPRKQAVR